MYFVMRHILFALLPAFAIFFAMSAMVKVGGANAQESDGSLTAVCLLTFESAPAVYYLTEEEIAELDTDEPMNNPVGWPAPSIVGYPDPATGSCATENGELMDYDPVHYTPICVPSGPERNGPLVVQWALTHYLEPWLTGPDAIDIILADPETGACPLDGTSEPLPGESGGADIDAGAAESSGSAEVATGGTDSEDGSVSVSDLPNTGIGTSSNGSESMLLAALMAVRPSLA